MVAIDTDVLVLAFTFHADPRQAINTQFLEKVLSLQPAITIYNLMELLGQLSFNLSGEALNNWRSWLVGAYALRIIWPDDIDGMNTSQFRDEIFERPLTRMKAYRMPFLDSLVVNLIERTPEIQTFVTWNARHFRGKTSLQVFTPETYLAHISS
ncbi:MAG: hypothetical protein HUU38_27120 [Anaerolineales bacterium]|nr:hypothetical protein [Anaerolineales bacterium]